MSGALLLEDGTVLAGESVGAEGVAVGEAVFTTGMSGYQEVVTDPSFSGQIVCFTAPMVGNYGVSETRSQSGAAHARAVLMREPRGPAWTDWLIDRGVVALGGLDTRSLTLHRHEAGAMRAAVSSSGDLAAARAALEREPPMAGRALAPEVSTAAPYVLQAGGSPRIALVDYGVKRSLLALVAAGGAELTVFPHDADAASLERFDAVVLSSGPGDPSPLEREVATVRALLGRVPLFGVCLGVLRACVTSMHERPRVPSGRLQVTPSRFAAGAGR